MWSRVLNNDEGETIEVNLTPIPCCFDSSWEKDVKPIRIRRHRTMLGQNDQMVKELPEKILAIMKENLGEELVNRLLSEDFLTPIDWDKYNQKCNGGANFDDIKKD
jgi:hypothetical protein